MRSMEEPATPTADMTLAAYSEALASAAPVPGGGSVAAVAASMAAALAGMVVRISHGREAYQAHTALHEEASGTLEAVRLRCLELADEDAAAFGAYLAARRLPREPEGQALERAAAIREAARTAASVPLAIVQECYRLAQLIERLAGRTNAHASSDLDVAALVADAAARGAAANAIANLDAVDDAGFADAVLAELDQRIRQTHKATARTREQVRRDGPRGPEAA
jgi:methenyltetrahydrofolate cyclohydrolase